MSATSEPTLVFLANKEDIDAILEYIIPCRYPYYVTASPMTGIYAKEEKFGLKVFTNDPLADTLLKLKFGKCYQYTSVLFNDALHGTDYMHLWKLNK